MPIEGTINSLYLDYEQTKPLFPRTKTKAISDDNGTGLNVLLDDIHAEIDELTYSDVGAAPTGYGLGGYCKMINSWNNAYSCGWYSSMGDAPDNEAFWHGIVSVDPNTGRLIQRVWKAHPTFRGECIRYFDNGSFSEWEWVNPPMVSGVEYRTTERYNNKPVYTQTLTLACPSNGASASINFGTGRIIVALRSVIDSDHPAETPIINGDTGGVGLFAFYNKADGKMYVQSTSDFISGGTCRIFVEYIKS